MASGSQWSLTFEVRKSKIEYYDFTPLLEKSQWSLTFEVRKRALIR